MASICVSVEVGKDITLAITISVCKTCLFLEDLLLEDHLASANIQWSMKFTAITYSRSVGNKQGTITPGNHGNSDTGGLLERQLVTLL